MIKLDTKKEIETLSGLPIGFDEKTNWTMGSYLPEIIMSSDVSSNIRKIALALEIGKADGEIEISLEDIKIIKGGVKITKLFKSQALNTLFNGRVEMYLEELEAKK